MALEEHLAFAESKSIETGLKFPDVVVELVSSRPSVFAEAMDAFPELRSLVIRIVHTEFFRYSKTDTKEENLVEVKEAVIIKPRKSACIQSSECRLPLSVILSISVVFGTWRDSLASATAATGEGGESAAAVCSLVDALMCDDAKEKESDAADDGGLASAVMAGDPALAAVSVESVSKALLGCFALFGYETHFRSSFSFEEVDNVSEGS